MFLRVLGRERPGLAHYTPVAYVSASPPRGISVHTAYRKVR